MTFSFNEMVINDLELNSETYKVIPNFIGYLNPNGIPIKYDTPFGLGGHDRNSCTDLFTNYFYFRPSDYKDKKVFTFIDGSLQNMSFEEYEKIKTKQMLKHINNNIERSFKENLSELRKSSCLNIEDRLELDLLKFFKNCYSAKNFFEGFGREIYMFSEDDYYKNIYSKLKNKEISLEASYLCYQRAVILQWLKDIYVQYLGYHSVERFQRTIVTSATNVYELFFNYIIEGFRIDQISKYIFNENKKSYEERKVNEFFVSESELRLKQEAESILRMVPQRERHKYRI